MSEWNGLEPPRRWWAAAAIWIAVTMAVLDASIANVALPSIARDLHAPGAESVWVVNAYQLAIVVSLLPLASLGDIVEHRRVMFAGLLLFTLASIACAFVRTLPALAAARAVQGLGAAGVMSVNGALLRFTVPRAQLGRWIGLNALVVSLGSVVGPALASAVLAFKPWPWLFLINGPIGVPALFAAWRALPSSPRSARRFDWISASLNILAFGLFFAGADMAARADLLGPGIGALAAAAAAAWLLVRRSLGQAEPLAPVDLMRSPLLSLSVLTSVACFAAQALGYVALPFHLEGALGRSAVQTGLLMTAWPVAVGLAAPVAGRLADRFSAAILSGAGLAVMAGGLLGLGVAGPHDGPGSLAARLALCGLGFGFFQAPNNRILLSSAPLNRSGAAGGLLASARLTGQTLGATLAAVVFERAAGGPAAALLAGAGFALAAAAISLTRLRAAATAPA